MGDDQSRSTESPSLGIPQSEYVVDVYIINTTCDIVAPAWAFVEPVQPGHEHINLPTHAFLVHHKELDKYILFDLGCRKDWWNLAPAAKSSIVDGILALSVNKGMDEILRNGGVEPGKIDGVIWSHWHYDHIGDISKFPQSAELYVGPGFKEKFMPGYPERKENPIWDTDLNGRDVIEVDFKPSSPKIGRFPTHDLFGDGSFYILSVPGHAVGHLGALARTTSNTFVFMGGDVCHFGGSFRPSPFTPLPSAVPASTPLGARLPSPCPSSVFFAGFHRDPTNARTTPFYRVTQNPKGWYLNPQEAQRSVDGVAELDAAANVLVCVAHDTGLLPVLEYFPSGPINNWEKMGWKEKARWGFLNELPTEGKSGRPWLAPGLIRDGVKVSPMELAD